MHEHYDPDGTLTGTTVVTIPGWSDDDRAWAIGLGRAEAIHQAGLCPRGHALAESSVHDPEVAWVGEEPIVCLACLALESSIEKANARKSSGPVSRSRLFQVRKVSRKRRG